MDKPQKLPKRQHNTLLIILIAIAVTAWLGYEGFGWEEEFKNRGLAIESWQTFQEYLGYAQEHDLERLRALSHQMTEVCTEPVQEEECFALMDGAYNFSKDMKAEDFRHVLADERQVMMYTDGPFVLALFFVIDEVGDPKVLGMLSCLEEDASNPCIEAEDVVSDQDGDGFWDITESLFRTPN